MTGDTFSALLNSDQVTDKTREVLQQRLNQIAITPAFFTAEEFNLLQSVCDCLLAQQPDDRPVDLAGMIDQRLAAKTGPGWRYNQLPADGVAYQTGLKGIAEGVLLLYGKNFDDLSAEEKNNLLKTVREDTIAGETWKNFSAKLFFELMLTEATEHFYSHPAAQAEINYTGFADAKGWNVPQLKPEI
ncbi:MAG: gluconate 2-dehydrogenase subunit 3 family protein [Janthinobacterium lividum]